MRAGIALLSALAVAGCVAHGPGRATTAASPAALRGAWAATKLDGRPAPPRLLRLEFDEASVRGTIACNSFGSTYRIEGAALAIAEASLTTVGCGTGFEASERIVADALFPRIYAHFEDGGKTLVLTGLHTIRLSRSAH